MTPAVALLADIGGTNARFALWEDGRPGRVERLAVADFPGPLEAARHFLETTASRTPPTVAALAVAGPVDGGRAALTNGAWSFSADELRVALGLERLALINDFAAQAMAIPKLGEADRARIGGGHAVAKAARAVLGPGTGLGVAGLVPIDGGMLPLATEGGHVTMAAADEREARLLDYLRTELGHVSAEQVLSGDGLRNLYDAVRAVDGLAGPDRTAAAITEAGRAGSCPASAATLETFCAMLGTVAGNLALSLGARGGIYIAGGIVPRFADYLAGSPFRARFEAKGRMCDYVAAIPTIVVTHRDPAFLGLAALAERPMAGPREDVSPNAQT